MYSLTLCRMDLIPFYARLAATLHPCLDDVASTLVEILIKDLRFQIKKKDQVHIHSKLKNVRFLGTNCMLHVHNTHTVARNLNLVTISAAELTKFGLCPKAETMKCITVS